MHVSTARMSDPHEVLNSKCLKILGCNFVRDKFSAVKMMLCVNLNQNSIILSLMLSHNTFFLSIFLFLKKSLN